MFKLRGILPLIASVLVLALVSLPILASGEMRRAPIIVNGHLRTAEGNPLRGTAFFIDVFQDLDEMLANLPVWRQYFADSIQLSHINIVRLAPWMSQYEINFFTGSEGENNRNRLLLLFDTVIQWAEDEGIYVLLNQHTQFNTVINLSVWEDWWDIVAPRYLNRTHVIYEATNEPEVASANTHMTTMFNHLRALAPNKHIQLWSFANIEELPIAQIQAHGTIDYSNASIGGHAYFETSTQSRWNHMEAIRAAGFPVMMNEFHSLTNADNLPIDYFNMMFNIEQAEARGLSWVTWAPYISHALPSKDPDWRDGIRFNQDFTDELRNAGIAFWPLDTGDPATPPPDFSCPDPG